MKGFMFRFEDGQRKAKENGVKLIDVREIEIINDKRSKEKNRK